MPSSGLSGPYALTTDSINKVVTYTSPGAYALGETRDGTFYISYVGRADSDVNTRLKVHAGSHPEFKFGYYATAAEAFAKECELYHAFNPPKNSVHPARPQGSSWTCPRCYAFG